MAIGAIIVTSLSYASQMSVADMSAILRGSITKLAPLLVRSWRPFWVCNSKQDSMPTKMDCNQ